MICHEMPSISKITCGASFDQGPWVGGVMYAARLIAVLLLILLVLIAYNPQARETVVETWENIRPVVVAFMDSFYTAIRNLITGNSDNPIDETPTPETPGVNFERIVTFHYNFSL
jgi:hypothetical protein